MWMIVVAGIAVMVVFAFIRRRFERESDLGSVTERWLAEWRAAQAGDSG
jgi:uncharacterized membrane protein